MATLLLLLIYIAFISLGLPDSIFGVSWPAMRADFDLGLEYGGYVTFIVTMGTVLSSLFSGYIISKLKTGKVAIISVFLTALALLGISSISHIWLLMIFALPLGFGAGSIDTALNSYVALHYKPHHMNWLHSFWGVGATIGPLIMSHYLLDLDWQKGYLVIAIIQFVLLGVLVFALPLWKRNEENGHIDSVSKQKPSILKIKGVFIALFIFFVYCAVESSVGLWGSSYLVEIKGMEVALAAKYIMTYFIGITCGRFLSGFLSFKLPTRKLIFGGITVFFIGALIMLLAKENTSLMISLIIMGIGLAPIFPSMIHDTLKNFGKENAQYVVGYQIAFAYLGFAIFPPLFGLIFSNISIDLFPLFVFILASILLVLLILLVMIVHQKREN